MTPAELTQRAVDAYNGQQWPRAMCLLLMALLAERGEGIDAFEGIKTTDLAKKEGA